MSCGKGEWKGDTEIVAARNLAAVGSDRAVKPHIMNIIDENHFCSQMALDVLCSHSALVLGPLSFSSLS